MKYIELPVMQCDPDCGQCCGPVPCKSSELERVIKYARERGIDPLEQGTTCPFYLKGTCSVYPVRPALCRLFGHVDEMRCAKGYNVATNSALVRRFSEKHLPHSQDVRFIHEVLGENYDEALCRALAGVA